jgi:hypothetical protein
MLGMEYRNDFSQYLSRDYAYPDGRIDSASSVKESYARNTASVYLADEYRFHDRWSLNVGVRYDKASDLDGNWSPRVALIYQPDFRTTLKASYSEAFRMPNADDRSFYGDGARPEYVAAKEFVVQHNLDRRMRVTGTVVRISAQQADGRRQRQRRLCGGGQQPGPGWRTGVRGALGQRRAWEDQRGLAKLARYQRAGCHQLPQSARQVPAHLALAG